MTDTMWKLPSNLGTWCGLRQVGLSSGEPPPERKLNEKNQRTKMGEKFQKTVGMAKTKHFGKPKDVYMRKMFC